jgi:UDP-N-acetylglucosamine 4-epimerase
MTTYERLQRQLRRSPRTWLVTGAAGFIGSNLVEALLRLDQRVVGLDNFSTGKRRNLEEVQSLVSPDQWRRLRFIEGDIREAALCRRACAQVDYVLHQAALGSVPRSIEDPQASHDSNVTGTLAVFLAAREAKVRRVVYASSSSVYGDEPGLPKVEDRVGVPLSPYAATKAMNEIYARVFAQCYGLESIGLRYFNVFGPRQDPEGPYAAVIPKWISALVRAQPVRINGDGLTSRDFCYIANVVQVNLLAAVARHPQAVDQVYNVAVGARTTLNQLYTLIRDALAANSPGLRRLKPVYGPFRPGDVRHSHAHIGRARRLLGYAPTHTIEQGLAEALDWYKRNP